MTSTTGVYWGATVALYVLALALLWPTLAHGVVGLDDVSLLREFAEAPFSSVFGRDHFGHFRPVKNLLFWWLSRDVDQLGLVRAIVLLVALSSGALLQRLAALLTGARWWALLAAGAWLLNPTTAATVAWLSAANYVFALLFVLIYVALIGGAPLGSRWPDRIVVVIGHVALFLAMLSHELCLMAPLVLLVGRPRGAEAPALGRRPRAVALGAAVPLAVFAALRVMAGSMDVAYRSANHPKPLLVLSSARYALTDLRLWLWQPGSFGVLLSDDPGQNRWLSVLAWMALAALVGLALQLSRRDPPSRVGLAWVALFLVPTINLVPLGNTPVAMHYLYLPGAGLGLLLARAAQLLAGVLPKARALPAVLASALILAWLPEYRGSALAWEDTVSLYQRTLESYPANVEVRANMVSAYLERDQLAEADALLVESLRIAPQEPALVGNRFELLWRTERWAEALSFLDSHTALLRGHEYTYRRGRLLEAVGRPLQALPLYAAVAEGADDPELRFAAGYQHATILVNAGRIPEAKLVIERMLKEFPGDERLELTYQVMTEQEARPE